MRLTDGDAEAVKADEVLAAVAAGDLGAVAALLGRLVGGNRDLLGAVGTTLGGGVGKGGHGGEDDGLGEHVDDLGLVGGKGWESECD